MPKTFLDAGEIAHVAHDAVYRAWFRLGGSVNLSPWDQLPDHVKRDARDAVSARMRGTYQNDRFPVSIASEYAPFWRRIVDAAINLSYEETPSND